MPSVSQHERLIRERLDRLEGQRDELVVRIGPLRTGMERLDAAIEALYGVLKDAEEELARAREPEDVAG